MREGAECPMDIVMWLLTGGVIGWVTHSYLGYNAERGLAVSMAIGATGAMVAGRLLAPMLFAPAAASGDFSASLLFFVAAVSAVFLLVGNLVYERWGV
jgi:uncharacterized membrane protein YeaQ/YmgE (transglycosylase-associated protein family)